MLDLIREQPARTAVIICEAASYRDEQVAPFVPAHATTPLAPEDIWVPQLHALADAATDIAAANQLYVALDANELRPIRAALGDLLQSIYRCGVMSAEDEKRGETILSRRVDQWDQWIASGHAGLAIRDVDALPASVDDQKPFLRVQLMHKAGLRLQALEAIRTEFLPRDDLNPSTRTRLALIAEAANASRLAADLLAPAIDALDMLEDLESALGTLTSADAPELANRVAERLEARLPGSRATAQRVRSRLLEQRDYAELADLVRANNAQEATYFEALARTFAATGVPDYLALIDSAHDADEADAFRLAAVGDALHRGLTRHAFDLVLTPPASEKFGQRWERLLLRTLERCFLTRGPNDQPPIAYDRMEDGIRRLLATPMNEGLRSGIVGLLRPNIAGTEGLALIAKITIDEARKPRGLDKGTRLGSASMTWLFERRAFLDKMLAWLKSEDSIVIGRLAMPAELLTEDPNAVIAAIADYLEKVPVADKSDIETVHLFLTLAATVAPHGVDPDTDLRLYRLASGKLASAGFGQDARDLVETALQTGSQNPRRLRLAWFALADVYHRQGPSCRAGRAGLHIPVGRSRRRRTGVAGKLRRCAVDARHRYYHARLCRHRRF